MQNDIKEIEKLKVKYEKQLMKLEGVSGIGIGICKSGSPCLKIYTSISPEKVIPRIPKELSDQDIEVEFVGDITIQ